MSRKKSRQKPALFISELLSTFIHTFLVMGFIAFIFYDAYAEAINADSGGAILIAVLTVFFTNGMIEALFAAFVVATVVPALLKL